MAIFGTAILALCLIVGSLIGRLVGYSVGIDRNLGGVGIAMLLLIVCTDKLRTSGKLSPPTQSGILFWSSIYIPIVVAMAATQNVRTALTGSWAAVAAGTLSVIVCFALVPLLSGPNRPDDESWIVEDDHE